MPTATDTVDHLNPHAVENAAAENDNASDPLLTHEPFEKYADVEQVEEALPLTSYAGLMTFYAAAFSFLLANARKKEKEDVMERMDWNDFLVYSLAVFHLSRTISKGWITIPLRASFAKYVAPSPLPSEVIEAPRGKGLQRVLGELLTCPFCLGTWVGLGLGYGRVFAPRGTRLLTGIAATSAVSGFLHFAYSFACKKTQE